MRGSVRARRRLQVPFLVAACLTAVMVRDSCCVQAWSLLLLPRVTSRSNRARHNRKLYLPRRLPLSPSHVCPAASGSIDGSHETDSIVEKWMRHGLLFSSFSDGVVPNPSAQEFWRRGLVRAMLLQEQREMEHTIERSVKFSPCSGPDVVAIDRLEDIDDALRRLESEDPDPTHLLRADCQDAPRLRFAYVPTAMYALRLDSNNTPGKQRQRARADAKKRRDEIVRLLQSSHILGPSIPVDVVTLDWDDGTVKHPVGPCTPTTGREALTSWKPHLIYVQGGNTFWLHHCLERGGWGKPLLDLVRSGSTFYCGSSAGAILAGASMEPACWKEWDDCRIVPDRERYSDWDGVEGLSLVGDASFFPHMTEDWQGVVDHKRRGRNVVCLGDREACLVDGAARTLSVTQSPLTTHFSAGASGVLSRGRQPECLQVQYRSKQI